MTPRILRKPQAARDILQIASYISEDSLDASIRFLEAVETTFLALARRPLMGASRTFKDATLAGIRMWRVKGFESYLIFYRPLADGIDVVRLVHGARDIETLFRGE